MSLTAFALRIAAVRAIRAAVWPEVVVADSPETPLSLLDDGTAAIAVYTRQHNDGLEGNELLAGDPRVSLTIQIFLPPELTVTVANKPVAFDTRKEGAETVLDVMARRILTGLVTRSEPWSELWGRLVTRTRTIANSSYLIETQDVRTSARELTLECETLYEPIPGAMPQGVWAELIALMRAESTASTGSVAYLADWIAAEITGPALLTQDERDRIDLGLSAYAAQAVSILPIVRGSEIGEVEVTVDGPDGDQVVVPGPAASPN